jgi:tetratricopeptide (TPR) repeat protein
MRPKREDRFIACLSSCGLQAMIVAQNEVMGQRSGADEHFRPAQPLQTVLIDPSLRAVCQMGLGLAYQATGQVQRAIELYSQARVAVQQVDPSLESRALRHLGTAYRDMGQAREAITYYSEALDILREHDVAHGRGAILGNLGNAYHHLGEFDRAIGFYERAVAIYRKTGNRRREGAELSNWRDTHRAMGEIDKAIQLYEEALVIAQEIGDRRAESYELGGLGHLYGKLGRLDRAAELCGKALVIAQETGDLRGQSVQLGQFGILCYARGQIDLATDRYQRALHIASEIGDRRKMVVWTNRLGDIHLWLREYDRAIDLYESALASSREMNYRLGESYQLLGLSRALLGQRQAHQAGQLAKEALALDILANDRRAGLVLGIATLFLEARGARDIFEDVIGRCRKALEQTADLYETQYMLAAALVGQAVSDPHWSQAERRTGLLASALAEYRRALGICAAKGVVQDAIRDLELIRAAGVEGLEPIFELLEGALEDEPGGHDG